MITLDMNHYTLVWKHTDQLRKPLKLAPITSPHIRVVHFHISVDFKLSCDGHKLSCDGHKLSCDGHKLFAIIT